MYAHGCAGNTIFRDKVMYEVEFEVLSDCDVTWYVEKGIAVKPDLTDPKLELHIKGSCCGMFERIIYSVFKNDFTGRGKQVSHYAYCAWCGHHLSSGLRNEVTKESLSNFSLYFGKHKGKKLSEIPDDYLQWCLENIKDDKLKKKIAVYLDKSPPTPAHDPWKPV